MKIMSVVGARPNFMKIAPFIKAIAQYNEDNGTNIKHTLVHTGQHYDDRMSKRFFESLGIPEADINLGIGSGTHAEQVGRTMIAFEKTLIEERPDWVVVVGDVNATLACSVTAKKLHIKVCHIEAGLRSGDIRMPEEVNRLVTDRLSDLLLVPDRISFDNLKKEGTSDERIDFVGNIMIDTLDANYEKANVLTLESVVSSNLIEGQASYSIDESKIAVITMHRPSNVDDKDILTAIFNFLIDEVSTTLPLVWPIHPRTKKNLMNCGLWEKALATEQLILLHPVGYHEMMKLNILARILLTDSGGLQEESCVLGTPCLTLRWNTERPITLKEHGGAGTLVGNNIENLRNAFLSTLKEERAMSRPELWDGNTAKRCVEAIVNTL